MLTQFFYAHQSIIIQFLIVAVVGFIAIKVVQRLFRLSSISNRIEPTVGNFFRGLIRFILYATYFIVLLTILGVPITSFIAMLSAIGLAIALALQGNLSNFASALVILFFKPFKVGDFIESQSNLGTVKEIQLLFTHVMTPDNRMIIIPNSELVNARVINYSAAATRRIDLIFGAGYDDPVEKVIAAINTVVQRNNMILKDPEPIIRLGNHGPSALEYDVKVWAGKDDYWAVKYQLNEDIRQVFLEQNIKIPYPQREVWMGKE